MTHDRHARCAPAAPLPLSPCRRTFPGAPRTTPPTRRRPSSTSALLRAGATVTHRLRNRLRDDLPSTTSSAARHACTDEVRARPAGAATGDATRAGQAHWPRPRQPRSAGLAAARVRQRDRGGTRLPAPISILPLSRVWGATPTRGTRREGHQDALVGLSVDPAADRAARVSGFRRGHGGGAARLPAPTLIFPAPASRGVRGVTRGTRREGMDAHVGLAVDPAGDRAARVSVFVGGATWGGGCAAAGPDIDLAVFCVARGLGRDTGDATRMAGHARRPRGRSRWRPRSAGFGVQAGLRWGGLCGCRPRC